MTEVHFPNNAIVTEQEIDLSRLNAKQKDYYIRLAGHVSNIYEASGKNRYIIGIGGPSGSGKSVTTEILRILISQQNPYFAVYTADIDAFHYGNKYLLDARGHDGKKLNLVKGRYDTYDTVSLENSLRDFVGGKMTSFPCYSRKFHEPVPNCYTIKEDKALILLAGLWILYDHPFWDRVRQNIGYTFLMHGDHKTIQNHAVQRHIRGGRSKEEAEIFYATSDAKNLKELEKNSVSADELLPHYEEVV